jgi:nitrate/nitrite-specific signal transduction histidine kinase
MTREEAIDFLLKNSGSQYDPRVVGTFITHLPEFEAEIAAHRDVPLPTFGIEPPEQLSEAAREVAPAAGLAETKVTEQTEHIKLSRRELAALYELAQSLHRAQVPAQAAEVFMEQLSAIVPYETCAITLTSEATGDNMIAYAGGQHASLLRGRKIELGEGVTGWVIANRKPFCNTDPRLDLPSTLAEQFAPYRTLAVFLLITDTEVGAVALYSSALAEYSEDQQTLLKEAAALFSSSLSAHQASSRPDDSVGTSQLTHIFEDSSSPLAETKLESELAH